MRHLPQLVVNYFKSNKGRLEVCKVTVNTLHIHIGKFCWVLGQKPKRLLLNIWKANYDEILIYIFKTAA